MAQIIYLYCSIVRYANILNSEFLGPSFIPIFFNNKNINIVVYISTTALYVHGIKRNSWLSDNLGNLIRGKNRTLGTSEHRELVVMAFQLPQMLHHVADYKIKILSLDKVCHSVEIMVTEVTSLTNLVS